MTIALLSPIATRALSDYLDEEYRDEASQLSSADAPAVTTLALEWLKSGHRLIVFTLDNDAIGLRVLKGRQLTVYVGPALAKTKVGRVLAPFGRDTLLLLRMVGRCKEHIDVVSAHWTRDFAIAALYFGRRCPIFVTVRDIMPYIIKQVHGWRKYAWYLHYMRNELVMRQRRIHLVANSEYTAVSVKKYWNRETALIPNAISDKYLSPYPSEPRCDSTFRIATISTSMLDDSRKNLPTLLNALRIVRQQYSNIELSLIGPTFVAESPAVKRFRQAGLLDGVTLVGALSHDDVVDYLRSTDLMVHPSLEETFGNTLIESMAAGCPVLGGEKSGAVPYVLDFGRKGYLCDVTSAEALASKIIYIIAHPEQRRTMAEDAKEYCRTTFSSRLLAEKYITLFNTAIAESGCK